MALTFKIPRQTDAEIVKSLNSIRAEVFATRPFRVVAHFTYFGKVDMNDGPADLRDRAEKMLAANTHIGSKFQFIDHSGPEALVVVRQLDQPVDLVTISDSWISNIADEAGRSVVLDVYPVVVARARKLLKASNLDASAFGKNDDAWTEFRNQQVGILGGLETTLEDLLVKAAKNNLEADKLRSERFAELEKKLREELHEERQKIHSENRLRIAEVENREMSHLAKEKDFETKEARYVARQGQQAQIDQIKGWLEDWKLTKGTSRKRWPITAGYIAALAMTAGLSLYASLHNYSLIQTADDLAKLQWWHWLLLTSKAVFPLAAFTTFMIYFIRWSGAWAKQHSQEEFLNRTRLIDIGRASWLLEAVRDAHENQAQIPSELLHELSRNLFSNSTHSDGDIHPSAISDLLLQGMTSIRVKSTDGSEFEAARGKSK